MTAPPKEPRPRQCGKTEDPAPEEGLRERSYYYDDAHGYEAYDPESEEADEAEDVANGDPDQKGV